MNITLYLRYATRCYSTDRMEWDVELSDEQYEQFLKARKERQEEFDDILEGLEDDETLEDNEQAMDEYMLLNYEILEELFPDWCYQQKEEFIEDAKSYSDNEADNENLTADNVVVDGFYIDEDEIDEEEYHFDEEEIKKNGIKVNLTYTVSLGRGDGGDECEWDATMTYDELKKYLEYKNERGSQEYLFEDMEQALPEWADTIYEEIADDETDKYRDNIDPDEDDYDEVMSEDWSITDAGTISIYFSSFGDEEDEEEDWD